MKLRNLFIYEKCVARAIVAFVSWPGTDSI